MQGARYPPRDRLDDCLPKRRVLVGELPEEMAVVLFAQRLPQRSQDGARTSARIHRLEPGAIADLPDEVERSYRMRFWAASVGRLELRCQRSGKIHGEVPDLSLAQLGSKALQHRPRDICRFFT